MSTFKFELGAIILIGGAVFCSATKSTRGVQLLVTAGIVIAVVVLFAMLFRALNRGLYAIKYDGINNTIVGYDPDSGAYLVVAPGTRAITGLSTNVPGNLPAHLHYYDRGMYVVDPNHRFGTPGSPSNDAMHRIQWQRVEPGYEIYPRGEGKNWDGILADQMAGYSYNYIHKKGTSKPDVSAPGVRKL